MVLRQSERPDQDALSAQVQVPGVVVAVDIPCLGRIGTGPSACPSIDCVPREDGREGRGENERAARIALHRSFVAARGCDSLAAGAGRGLIGRAPGNREWLANRFGGLGGAGISLRRQQACWSAPRQQDGVAQENNCRYLNGSSTNHLHRNLELHLLLRQHDPFLGRRRASSFFSKRRPHRDHHIAARSPMPHANTMRARNDRQGQTRHTTPPLRRHHALCQPQHAKSVEGEGVG